jgi:hypothetical protein
MFIDGKGGKKFLFSEEVGERGVISLFPGYILEYWRICYV